MRISGRKLAAARQAVYMTQRELADAINYKESNVSRIEALDDAGIFANRVPLLARALRVPEDEVLERLAPGPSDTVSVELPRHLYDYVAAKAQAKGMAFGDYLIWRLSPKGGMVRGDLPAGAPEPRRAAGDQTDDPVANMS